MTGIVVMADYQADPVWAADDQGRPGSMLHLDGLPASDQLKADLRAWRPSTTASRPRTTPGPTRTRNDPGSGPGAVWPTGSPAS